MTFLKGHKNVLEGYDPQRSYQSYAQSQKYLLPVSSQKDFANLWINPFGIFLLE